MSYQYTPSDVGSIEWLNKQHQKEIIKSAISSEGDGLWFSNTSYTYRYYVKQNRFTKQLNTMGVNKPEEIGIPANKVPANIKQALGVE